MFNIKSAVMAKTSLHTINQIGFCTSSDSVVDFFSNFHCIVSNIVSLGLGIVRMFFLIIWKSGLPCHILPPLTILFIWYCCQLSFSCDSQSLTLPKKSLKIPKG